MEEMSEVQNIGAQMRTARAAIARKNPNAFTEFVMKDDKTGQHFRQAPIHRTWHKLIDRYPRLILWSHVEAGKAVPLDTPIPSPEGWRTMGDLRRGDVIFGDDGRPCCVAALSEIQHDRELFEVEFDDGGVERADAEHNWLAWSLDDLAAHGMPRVVTTRQMLATLWRKAAHGRQQPKWKIPVTGAADYPERSLPIHPYVLGAWLGDGDTAGPVLTFHKDDRFIYDRCAALEGATARGPRADGRNPNVWRGNIGGSSDKRENHDPNRLRLRLRKLELLHNKHIPELYLTAGVSQRRELLAGLCDTDGSCDGRKNKSIIEFSNSNEVLARGVLELVRSLGFKGRIAEGDAVLNGEIVGKKWRVTWTAREAVFQLPRKLALQKLDGDRRWTRHRSVVAIRPIASVPVRCITVDSPRRTYLMGHSYTVTHNTAQLTSRLLYEIGADHDIRAVICGNTAEQGFKTNLAVERYIERDDDLRLVHPDLLKGDPWTRSQMFVERRSMSRDPTLQAIGVHGNILGARIDFLLMDDVLDYENTRTPAAREDLWNWYHSTLVGRLTANARIVIIGNAWHPEDLLHRLAKSRAWAAFKFPVYDEKTDTLLWPEQWPKDRIEAKRLEFINPAEFARQMLCKARDDSDSRFKEEWVNLCLQRGADVDLVVKLKDLFKDNKLPPGYKTFTGVDLAVQKHASADRTVLFTGLIHPNGDRQPLWIDSGRWSGQEIIDRIKDHRERYGSMAIVENNASQDFIVQFASKSVPIKPFTTGRNKAHPEFGIEGIAAEMSQGRWIIPNKGGRKHPEIAAWIQEMLYYDPNAHTGDRLMASWFFREGAEMRNGKVQSGRLRITAR